MFVTLLNEYIKLCIWYKTVFFQPQTIAFRSESGRIRALLPADLTFFQSSADSIPPWFGSSNPEAMPNLSCQICGGFHQPDLISSRISWLMIRFRDQDAMRPSCCVKGRKENRYGLKAGAILNNARGIRFERRKGNPIHKKGSDLCAENVSIRAISSIAQNLFWRQSKTYHCFIRPFI